MMKLAGNIVGEGSMRLWVLIYICVVFCLLESPRGLAKVRGFSFPRCIDLGM